MRLRPLLALVLVCAPSASAGSAEHPEVTDEVGDEVAAYQGAPTGGDLVKAWFHDDTQTQVGLTLEVASLSAVHAGRFDVYWQALNSTFAAADPVESLYVARAELGPSMNGYELLRVFPESGSVERVAGLEGTVTTGSPGRIRWILPYQALGVRAGDLFRVPQATADAELQSLGGPRPTGRTDEAASPTSWFQLRLADQVVPFDAPARAADYVDDTPDEEWPLIDLQAAWADFTQETLDFTFSVHELEPAGRPSCEALYSLSLGDHYGASAVELDLQVRAGPNGTAGLEYVDWRVERGGQPVEYPVGVNLGAPGTVRLRVPRGAWEGSDVTTVRFTLWARVDCHGETFMDFMGSAYEDEVFGLPGASVALALAALALGAAWRRR